jgi:hypothetical protein
VPPVREVRVYPDEDQWAYALVEDDEVLETHEADDQRSAFAGARAIGGHETIELFDADGNPVGTAKKPGCRVVVLRRDGSEYGELEPAESTAGGTPIRVSIEPVIETSEATEMKD